jgi:hypothetical protein
MRLSAAIAVRSCVSEADYFGEVVCGTEVNLSFISRSAS